MLPRPQRPPSILPLGLSADTLPTAALTPGANPGSFLCGRAAVALGRSLGGRHLLSPLFFFQSFGSHCPSPCLIYLICVHCLGPLSGPPSPAGAPFAREGAPSPLPCFPFAVSPEHGRRSGNPQRPDVAEHLGLGTVRTCPPEKRLLVSRQGRNEVNGEGAFWSWCSARSAPNNALADCHAAQLASVVRQQTDDG